MILWLNPVSGLSGDMGVGTLLALGAPLDDMRAIVASTGLSGWALDAERVMTGGLTATRAVVTVDDDAPSRRAAELLDIVRQARPEPVAALAARAISAIARVEAHLHGEDARQVHLHEIGGPDTVVDTVAFAAGLHLLGITAVRSAPLTLGTGTVRTRHGVLPLPAPATVALLAEAQAQITGAAIDGETVTPTGAALLLAAAASYGPVPPMAVKAVGYGAGTRVVEDRPNVTQGLLGTPRASLSTEILLETNVDDVTGEVLGHLIRRALDTGAADAWVSPITMKKGRPAHTVHVLAPLHRIGRPGGGDLHGDRNAGPAQDGGGQGGARAQNIRDRPAGARDSHQTRGVGGQAGARGRGRCGRRARPAGARGRSTGPAILAGAAGRTVTARQIQGVSALFRSSARAISMSGARRSVFVT
ncbi:nickel pincer cofactor biosynthesis protein LarC [Streptomyces chiangmaiensis]|uniref:LarC family nickel insertion protein n=1 Tax=Streptomyces chiangmaiensis TaxID=766497 RepID=UPI003380E00E